MIELVDRGLNESLIRFTPRSQYKYLRTLECDLVQGYSCLFCNNIVQALFYTDKAIDIEKYEETRVLSKGEKNEGDLLKIVPNMYDPGNYKVDTYKTANGNAQRITLKNHVINWKGFGKATDEFFEVGERCCPFTSIISIQDEDVVRDLVLIGQYSYQLTLREDKPDPDLPFLLNWIDTAFSWETKGIRYRKAVGSGPPALMLRRETIKKSETVAIPFSLYKKWDSSPEFIAEIFRLSQANIQESVQYAG
jgi:hypothetical protein